MRAALLGSFLVLALAACAREEAPRSTRVVAERIAALEAEVARASKAERAPPADGSDDSLRARVLQISRAQSVLRASLLEDVRELGDGATPRLATLFADPSLDDGQRLAVLECLGALDTPQAAAVLAGFVESSPHAWARAQSAFQLGRTRQDQVVTRLLARLPHEQDSEARIWIADALGRFGNYAGVEALAALGRRGVERARERLAELAQLAGCASAEDLAHAWSRGDPERRLRAPSPSPRLELAVWRSIAALASSDARAAEEARSVLGASSAWVAEPLCRALDDESAGVRAGALESLARMGPRARAAGPKLRPLLDDAALAPDALEALGAIGHAAALPKIVERLDARTGDVRLRIAAARALGRLALPSAIPPLTQAIAPSEPLALRRAAAESLVALDRAGDAVPILVEALAAGEDRAAASAEAVLESWLAREAEDDSAARALLARWSSLAGPPGLEPDAASTTERRRERAAIVADALGKMR